MKALSLLAALLALSGCQSTRQHVDTIKNTRDGREVTYVYYVGNGKYEALYYRDGILVRKESIP